jgi:hypothetical protein
MNYLIIFYVLIGVVLINNRGLLANRDMDVNSDGISSSASHSSIAGKRFVFNF